MIDAFRIRLLFALRLAASVEAASLIQELLLEHIELSTNEGDKPHGI